MQTIDEVMAENRELRQLYDDVRKSLEEQKWQTHLAKQNNKTLEDALGAVEWVWVQMDHDGVSICPWCKSCEGEAHRADCLRELALYGDSNVR